MVGHVQSDTTNDRWRLRIKLDGTIVQDYRNPDCTANLSDTAMFAGYVVGGSAGSHTVTVTLERTTGSGTLSLQAAATTPATLIVEDIGPSS
jgi:hypothetical protein